MNHVGMSGTAATRLDETSAKELDARDPLREFRAQFAIPDSGAVADPSFRGETRPSIYLTGNSLGAMPRRVPDLLEQELEDWARLGVEGHLAGRDPWLPYHEQFRAPLGRLVGAMESEVVAMNSLTVNLHLLMASFYRPTRDRFKIIVEDACFPSDSYAVASQAEWHGMNPRDAVVRLAPREGEHTLRTDDIVHAIEREKPALVMLGAVNYLTGQWFDMAAVTQAGHNAGAIVGWDLAHAAGNVPMDLHDWGVDFAAWCSYKYLNSGPGAVAGAFVHERHLRDHARPRLAGWWGNDPATRFRMGPTIAPMPTADAWSLSNPPIFSLTPLKASLELFDRAGIERLREKSLALTGFMEASLADLARSYRSQGRPAPEVLTPREPGARGCQLSIVVPGATREVQRSLLHRGIVCDFREPNVIRAAPVPLYNTFHDVWRFVRTLGEVLG